MVCSAMGECACCLKEEAGSGYALERLEAWLIKEILPNLSLFLCIKSCGVWRMSAMKIKLSSTFSSLSLCPPVHDISIATSIKSSY